MGIYKIVKFNNGKYGIRRRTLLDRIFFNEGEFCDLVSYGHYWWTKQSHWFDDCQTDDVNLVIRKFQHYNPKEYQIVEIDEFNKENKELKRSNLQLLKKRK